MRKPRKLDLEKEKYWRALLHRFQKSGLSFRKFCEEEKLSTNTFQYWRKRIRERDEARGLTSTIRKGEIRPNTDEEKISFWLQVIDDANIFPGSLKEFCKKNSVASGSMYHWERRLKKLGLTAGLRKGPDQVLVPVRIADDEPAPASLKGTTAASSSKRPTVVNDDHKIEIRLHDGHRVLIPASLPAELLVELLNGLRGKK